MLTFLQIAIVLLLMALVGMLIGYIFGQFGCKVVSKDTMIKKGGYCEGEYAQKHHLNEQTDRSELEQLKDTFEKSTTQEGPNSVATPLMKKSEDTPVEDKRDLTEEKEFNSESKEEADEIENRSETQELKDNKSQSSDFKDEDEAKESLEEKDDNVESKELNQDREDNTNEENLQKDSEEKSQPQEDDNKQEPKLDKEDGAKALEDEYKPQFLSEPKDGKADNLCEIKGIGKVIDEKLKNLGIYHFEQIANWSEKDIEWIDEYLAFKGRVVREDWIGQAKLLAKGEETEFAKRVKKGEVASSKKD